MIGTSIPEYQPSSVAVLATEPPPDATIHTAEQSQSVIDLNDLVARVRRRNMAAFGNNMVERARIDNYDVLHGLDLFVKPMRHGIEPKLIATVLNFFLTSCGLAWRPGRVVQRRLGNLVVEVPLLRRTKSADTMFKIYD